MEDNAARDERALDAAQADLDAALRAFAGVLDERAARERIAELVAVRDEARAKVDHSLASYKRPVLSVNMAHDWDRLSLDEQRSLIRVVVAEARVAPGRGAGRISVRLVK